LEDLKQSVFGEPGSPGFVLCNCRFTHLKAKRGVQSYSAVRYWKWLGLWMMTIVIWQSSLM
jgi:hypothetical protein